MSRVNRTTATQSLSVSFAVGLYGIAFGAAGIAAGFSILQTCLLSLLTFSGASQFAVVGVMGAGGSALSGIATASLLGIRNTLYGLRMAPILKVRGWKKVVAAQITIDESTGVAIGQENLGRERRPLSTCMWVVSNRQSRNQNPQEKRAGITHINSGWALVPK